MIRIALLSKEAMFGEGLASLLNHHGSFQVVAHETDARLLVGAAKEQRCQMIVVDANLLDRNELQFLLGARAYGEFGIVLITDGASHDSPLEAPVDQVLSRHEGAQRLFEALGSVGDRVKTMRPSLVRESRRGGYGEKSVLTRREYEVAQLVARGLSNRRVAGVTGLREQSVKNLVSVIMRKLRCENRVQVALKLTQGVTVEQTEE
jgi:DNA-binding NarL/FixJ family response regulator